MEGTENKEEKCVKVDFTKVAVENIMGEIQYEDFSKVVGNQIYNQSKELGEVELAREIYRDGIVNITKKQSEMIMRYFAEQPYVFKHSLESAMKFED